ncbi:MAG: hypothetical protein AB8C40_02370 [Gammaproteobacteria bacterium]
MQLLIQINTKIVFILFLFWGVSSFANEANTTDNPPVKKYYVHDIKNAMTDHIANSVDKNGVFTIEDDKTGETLSLKFVKIHDPVRVIDGRTYFACTDFHVVGNKKKLYDLDFWMSPVDGKLKIFKTKIHKEPRKSLIYGWYKQPRYTFVDDKIVELY